MNARVLPLPEGDGVQLIINRVAENFPTVFAAQKRVVAMASNKRAIRTSGIIERPEFASVTIYENKARLASAYGSRSAIDTLICCLP